MGLVKEDSATKGGNCMLKRLLIAGGLALCCLSCTPAIQGGPGQPPFAADLEPYEEAVGKGRAHF